MPTPPTSTDADLVRLLRDAGCVFAEDEARLLTAEAANPTELAAMAERRVQGEPLELIVGWAEFAGLRIGVEPGVFVPRRRSEVLVREAAAVAEPGAVVLDLCCGSGAIGVALAAAVSGIELHCSDVDAAAVRCARRNAAPYGGHAYEGDLYAPLPSSLLGRVDVMVVNAPYVPTDSVGLMPPEARLYEPMTALDGGDDGLDLQRQVITRATRWLAPDGHLLIETGRPQAALTAAAYTEHGLEPRIVYSDELGGTAVIGRPVRP